MLAPYPRELQIYRDPNGREPFTEWLASIRDRKTRNRIQVRLDRLEYGHFGDCKSIGQGIFEIRLQFGAGYRIYFGEVDRTVVLILGGGDKSSQPRDIEHVEAYWLAYKESEK